MICAARPVPPGAGLPILYREIVSSILTSHMAVESVLIHYLRTRALKPNRQSFASRLKAVRDDLIDLPLDWSLAACGKLNYLTLRCAHTDFDDDRHLQTRIQSPLNNLVSFIKKHNRSHDFVGMSDFDSISLLLYRRLHEYLQVDCDPASAQALGELPDGLRQHFSRQW